MQPGDTNALAVDTLEYRRYRRQEYCKLINRGLLLRGLKGLTIHQSVYERHVYSEHLDDGLAEPEFERTDERLGEYVLPLSVLIVEF